MNASAIANTSNNNLNIIHLHEKFLSIDSIKVMQMHEEDVVNETDSDVQNDSIIVMTKHQFRKNQFTPLPDVGTFILFLNGPTVILT